MADSNPTVALLPDHESLAKDPTAIEDYSNEVTDLFNKLPGVLSGSVAGLEEATEAILVLEKKARQASDGIAASKLCCKLLELYKERELWSQINEFVVALCKKRGQLKRAITDMITLGISWLDLTPTKEIKLKLIQTLSSIAEGKIFVEVELARLIRKEVEMLEEAGKIDEAALLLQEVQVETYGAMDRREKSLFVLDQMRLVLARKDYIRLQIISRKMNPKLLDAEDFQDIKLQYYRYMIDYYLDYEKDYFNTALAYWSSFNVPVVQAGDDWKVLLSHYVIFLIMAPHSTQSLKLLQELKENEIKKLELIPDIKNLLFDFLLTELADWPLPYEAAVKAHQAFEVPSRWDVLHSRFMQHNILILSTYYNRISIQRAAVLLNIAADEIEKRVSELVNDRIIYARIDRPAGIISFAQTQTSAARLDSWASSISNLLNLLQETTHLINNDRMIHAALEKRRLLLERSKA